MIKKYLLALFIISFAVNCFAQQYVGTEPEATTTLVEKFTGWNCGPCVNGLYVFKHVEKLYDDELILLAYHATNTAVPYADLKTLDLRTAYGTALFNKLSCTGTPNISINRIAALDGELCGLTSVDRIVNQVSENQGITSPINIAGHAVVNVDTRIMELTIETYNTSDIPSNDYKIHASLIQNNLMGLQGGVTDADTELILPNGLIFHNHVFRNKLTPDDGVSLDSTSAGALQTETISFTIPDTMLNTTVELLDLELVLYVAENDNEIIQSKKASVELFSDLGQIVHGAIEVTGISENNLCSDEIFVEIQFNNNSEVALSGFEIQVFDNGTLFDIYENSEVVLSGDTLVVIAFDKLNLENGSNQLEFVLDLSGSVDNPVNISTANNAVIDYFSFVVLAKNQSPDFYEDFEDEELGDITADYLMEDALITDVTGEVTNIGAYGTSDKSYYWQTYYGEAFAPGRLLFGRFDASNVAENEDIIFSMDYSHANWLTFEPQNFDIFNVIYSVDCGITYKSLLTMNGNEIAAVTQNNGIFYPAPNQWTTLELDISEVKGYNDVILGFDVIPNKGVGIYLDNIKVELGDFSGTNALVDDIICKVYPVPSIENLRIESNSAILSVELMGLNGERLTQLRFDNLYHPLKTSIPVSDFPQGLYFIKLETAEGTIIKKVQIGK